MGRKLKITDERQSFEETIEKQSKKYNVPLTALEGQRAKCELCGAEFSTKPGPGRSVQAHIASPAHRSVQGCRDLRQAVRALGQAQGPPAGQQHHTQAEAHEQDGRQRLRPREGDAEQVRHAPQPRMEVGVASGKRETLRRVVQAAAAADEQAVQQTHKPHPPGQEAAKRAGAADAQPAAQDVELDREGESEDQYWTRAMAEAQLRVTSAGRGSDGNRKPESPKAVHQHRVC
jgi:hypothetical protein